MRKKISSIVLIISIAFPLQGMGEQEYLDFLPDELNQKLVDKHDLKKAMYGDDEDDSNEYIPFYWPPSIGLPIVHCSLIDQDKLVLRDCDGGYVTRLEFQDAYVEQKQGERYVVSQWKDHRGKLVDLKSGMSVGTKWHDSFVGFPMYCSHELVGDHPYCVLKLKGPKGKTLELTSSKELWLEKMKQYELFEVIPEKINVTQYMCLLKLLNGSQELDQSEMEVLKTMPNVERLFDIKPHKTNSDHKKGQTKDGSHETSIISAVKALLKVFNSSS